VVLGNLDVLERMRVLVSVRDARIGAGGRAILRDAVIDEELEMYVEQLVIEEVGNEIRAEVRSMIAEGVK
jgi:hypothetical protein